MIPSPVVGLHCILEMYGCQSELLNNEAFVRQALTEAADQGMSTLLGLTSHAFEPQGVTALALLAESHISMHTWPEAGYAAVDVFTCGTTAQPQLACAFLVEQFQAGDHTLRQLSRGMNVVSQHKDHEEVALCLDRN